MKPKKVNPSRPVRRPSKQDSFIPRSRCCLAKLSVQPEKMYNGKLTLYGLYMNNLLDIQNDREWDDNRCRLYDRVMCQYLGPLFANRPLEDLSLDDYVDLWNQLMKKKLSENVVSTAYTLIRLLAEMALRQGISYVYFWGDVHELLKGKKVTKAPFKLSDPAAQDKELRGTRISRSLSVKAELCLINMALERINDHGEVLAGILMFLLGLRTSEACGALFKDLVEIYPGYWALKRATARDPDSGDLDNRAKTKNGYRLIPIPAFLAAIIIDRWNVLKAHYPDRDVDGWTIACSGRQFSKSASQREVNAQMSILYIDAKCDQDLMVVGQEEMNNDPKLKKELENSLVAYLGRHQMITEMVAVGMPERYIFNLAGHAQMDPVADKADLNNLDTFLEVSDYLNRRPIVQLMDQSIKPSLLEVVRPVALTQFCDGEIAIQFHPTDDTPLHFRAVLKELEPSDPLSIELEGCAGVKEECLPWPPTKSTLLCNVPYLRKLVAINRNADPKHELITNWEDVPEEFSFSVTEPPEVKPATLSKRKSYKKKASSAPQPAREKKAIAASAFTATLTCLDDTGHAFLPEDDLFVLTNAGAVGKQIHMEKGRSLACVVPYDPERYNYVVTPDGVLCPIPARTRLDLLLNNPSGEKFRNAFLRGGFLLSHNGEPSSPTRLVVLTEQGSIVCITADCLNEIRGDGAKLVELLPEDGRVVAACFLEPGQDLLIISSQGKGLRVFSESLSARKSLGTKTINGIRLKAGDTAATCLPYSDKDLILVKNTGLLSVNSKKIPVRKGTNAEGVIVSEGPPVASAFFRPDVVVMVDTLGHMLFIDEAVFLSKSCARKGVKAQSIPAGSYLLHAFGLYYKQFRTAVPSEPTEADSVHDATVSSDSSGDGSQPQGE